MRVGGSCEQMLVQTFFYNKKRFTLARAQKPLLDPHRHNVSLEKAYVSLLLVLLISSADEAQKKQQLSMYFPL